MGVKVYFDTSRSGRVWTNLPTTCTFIFLPLEIGTTYLIGNRTCHFKLSRSLYMFPVSLLTRL